MLSRSCAALLCVVVLAVTTTASSGEIAPTPPMGWNSWDAFGLTINEADFKANAAQLAKLRSYGWSYAVIDEGWYLGNPFGNSLQDRQYLLNEHGQLIPVGARFPSSNDGRGFKPLGDWVHAQGLKFGIHIIRGIPKEAVTRNTPIANSAFHAADAADTTDTCPWDEGNYGVRDNAAGQAYYDSLMALYAQWGLDFIKVDCIADHPYKGQEIRQIASAIAKTGRPIVLSLSPGPTQPSHAAEIRQYAQMWRTSNDVWDGWTFTHKPGEEAFPMGVRDIFDHLAPWVGQAGVGHWPDADMLPWGSLAPHPGWGEPRHSRLTPDEERTQLTLLAMARSPLILGANLTQLDEVTRKLMTNREVIGVDQNSRDNHPVDKLPSGFENVRVWVAAGTQTQGRFLALFNLGEQPVSLESTWDKLGLDPGAHEARDLWEGRTLPASDTLKIRLPAHGSALYATTSPQGPDERKLGTWQPPSGLRQIPIWPNGAPDMEGVPQPGESVLTNETPEAISSPISQGVYDVNTPTLTVYPPKGKNTGAAIIVLPGGGFQMLAITIEGTEICDWLTAKGITCVLSKYRVPKSNHYWDEACHCHITPKVPLALQDAQRTIRLIRAEAKELNLNPNKIGVIGFSAGGYLVVQTSNMAPAYKPVDAADQLSSRPDFAIALYPGHLCRSGAKLESAIHVTKQTPPTFLAQAWDDPVDDICNSTVYARALDDAGVPAEVHLFAHGGHAFGLRHQGQPVGLWPVLVEGWLREMKIL